MSDPRSAPIRVPTGRRSPPPSPLRSTAAVAELLGVSERTVRRLVSSGDLAAHRIGRSVRIADDDLTAYLAQRR